MKRWRAPLPAATAIACTIAASSAIAAPTRRTAVAPPLYDVALDEANRGTAVRALTEGLRDGGIEVEDDAFSGTPCDAADCAREVATDRGVRHVITMSVRKLDADYEFALSLWDAQNGTVIAEVEDTCEICGLVELEDALRVAANSLAKKVTQLTRPATLIVRSEPPGAAVTIDGQPSGTTPLEIELMAGEHAITLEAGGHEALQRDLDLLPGVEETLELALDPIRAEAPPVAMPTDVAPTAGRGLRAGGWTALALGIGGLGAGIGLLVMDERPITSDCQADADGDCRFRYNTLGGGIGLAAAGVALVGTGIGLVVAGHKKKKKSQIRVGASTRGIVIGGRF